MTMGTGAAGEALMGGMAGNIFSPILSFYLAFTLKQKQRDECASSRCPCFSADTVFI